MNEEETNENLDIEETEEVEETTEDTEEFEEEEPTTYSQEELDEKVKEEIEKANKERDKRWKERMKNAQNPSKKEKEAIESYDANDALLARLENRGVMEEDDQSYVIKFAKAEGVSPIEALNDQVVIDRLAKNKKVREQQKASPTPSKRTGGDQVDDVAKWVVKYKKDGSLPDNPALVTKILRKLQEE